MIRVDLWLSRAGETRGMRKGAALGVFGLTMVGYSLRIEGGVATLVLLKYCSYCD